MNWGKWIVVSFVLFAIFIGTLVVICIRQNVNLVSRTYYKEELAFQGQIERIKNANDLEQKPVIAMNGQLLEISFAGFNDLENGELRLFRPSDERLDKSFVIHATLDSIQRFDMSPFPKGKYYARMKWSMKGRDYFVENLVTL